MKISLIANLDKPDATLVAKNVLALLEKKGIAVRVESLLANAINYNKDTADAKRICDGADVLITLGGDGTILRAAQQCARSGVPILGVNLGLLGFLTEVAQEEIGEAIDLVLAQKFFIEERLMVEASVGASEEKIIGVNEIVIDKAGSPRMLRLSVAVDGSSIGHYFADGIIISTPTGSTGYALATGGPIVVSSCEAFVIAPIAPHALTVRPIVVPSSSIITLDVDTPSHSALLVADGQDEKIIPTPSHITIKKAKETTKLIRFGKRTIYDTLREKFLLGKDERILNS